MMLANKTDVIVVGAGPAGISCAITIARSGKKVVLIERGNFAGSKNVFGGAIYTQPVKEIFPDFEESAPLERKNIRHNFAILGEEDSTVITYNNNKSQSYTVIRAKFDRWMAEEAKKEGVYLVENTVVKELLLKDKKVIGVKTELEDFYSDVVILADGVNSLLAKQICLRKKITTKDVALSVKEVIKINNINEKFNLAENEGCITEIFGGPMLNMLSLGFMYTNKNTVTIGFGISLEELTKNKLKPYELLDKLKEHPYISQIIQDGVVEEYSAHLIPEGGYNKLPKLYSDGVLVVGDAAMLVNNMHWEGTNLAMISGKLAGETVIEAFNKNDFTSKTLKIYKQKLKKSFVIQDLKTYKDLIKIAGKNKESFMGYYLKSINSFFEIFTSVDSVPKKYKYHKFVQNILANRKFGLLSDIYNGIKLVWGILWH